MGLGSTALRSAFRPPAGDAVESWPWSLGLGQGISCYKIYCFCKVRAKCARFSGGAAQSNGALRHPIQGVTHEKSAAAQGEDREAERPAAATRPVKTRGGRMNHVPVDQSAFTPALRKAAGLHWHLGNGTGAVGKVSRGFDRRRPERTWQPCAKAQSRQVLSGS